MHLLHDCCRYSSNASAPSTTTMTAPPNKAEAKEAHRVRQLCRHLHWEGLEAAIILFLMVRLLIGCTLSFASVSSLFFLDLIKELRPAFMLFVPRTTWPFRQTWLNRLYKFVRTTIKKKELVWMQQGHLRTLTLDGLKHNDGRKMNNVGEVIDGHAYFVDTFPVGASETAPVIQKQVAKALSRPRQENDNEAATAYTREQVHATYCGVSSDNTFAIRIGVKNACTNDFPQLVYKGCASHIAKTLTL